MKNKAKITENGEEKMEEGKDKEEGIFSCTFLWCTFVSGPMVTHYGLDK